MFKHQVMKKSVQLGSEKSSWLAQLLRAGMLFGLLGACVSATAESFDPTTTADAKTPQTTCGECMSNYISGLSSSDRLCVYRSNFDVSSSCEQSNYENGNCPSESKRAEIKCSALNKNSETYYNKENICSTQCSGLSSSDSTKATNICKDNLSSGGITVHFLDWADTSTCYTRGFND